MVDTRGSQPALFSIQILYKRKRNGKNTRLRTFSCGIGADLNFGRFAHSVRFTHEFKSRLLIRSLQKSFAHGTFAEQSSASTQKLFMFLGRRGFEPQSLHFRRSLVQTACPFSHSQKLAPSWDGADLNRGLCHPKAQGCQATPPSLTPNTDERHVSLSMSSPQKTGS